MAKNTADLTELDKNNEFENFHIDLAWAGQKIYLTLGHRYQNSEIHEL